MDELELALRHVAEGTKAFAASMREQGIHVGMGRKPYCVTCGDPWPCAASLEATDATDA